MDLSRIRNFCIIAHIDHGKSTLADRLLEVTGTVEQRKMRDQVLDQMDLERERGITIKLTPVRMQYGSYVLNLIDTPGHVDFSYEVSRSLAAVEGAILLVDATQGIQAQTLANLDLALRAGLTVLPVVNKIDVPSADSAGVAKDLAVLTGVPEQLVLRVSAKTGEGVRELLEQLVRRVPPPRTSRAEGFRALVFDSTFDAFQGVIVYVRVMDGSTRVHDRLAFAASGAGVTALDVGVFRPEPFPVEALHPGEIGYVATGLHDASRARVGDTILVERDRGRVPALLGYDVPQPTVYAGMYPLSGEAFPALREAVEKLRLSDAALTVELEASPALGQGFRCGFLGLLHLDIVRERLRREYGVEITLTVPSVAYRVLLRDGSRSIVRTAAEFPDPSAIQEVHEPSVGVTVIARGTDIGPVLQLFAAHEGAAPTTETLATGRVRMTSHLPLREVVISFHDELKAATSGYGSFSLQVLDERPIDLVKVAVFVNHEPVEALSVLLPAAKAAAEGRRIVERLASVIPRELFAVPLQVAIGGKIIARETIPALRKDVTGYLYGGDVTRKRKLLEKQKKGKKKLSARGAVTIPPEAYLAVLRR